MSWNDRSVWKGKVAYCAAMSARRLAAVEACNVLGTTRESSFDNLTYTVSQVLRAPVAAFLLATATSAWPKSVVQPRGFDPDILSALCRVAIEAAGPVLIDDLRNDARFNLRDSTIVPRFAVAAPVHGPGEEAIGCLCALDMRTRTASERQVAQLQQLARQGTELLLLRVPGLDVARSNGGRIVRSA